MILLAYNEVPLLSQCFGLEWPHFIRRVLSVDQQTTPQQTIFRGIEML